MRNGARFWSLMSLMPLLAAGCGENASQSTDASVTAEGAAISQDFYKRWTVTKWKKIPPGMKKAEHIVEGDSFEIAQANGSTVVRPQGGLADRWGFNEKKLDTYDKHLCLKVNLPHGLKGIPKSHLIVFTQARDEGGTPEPDGLDISFPHATDGLSCKNVLIHGGTAHAEN